MTLSHTVLNDLYTVLQAPGVEPYDTAALSVQALHKFAQQQDTIERSSKRRVHHDGRMVYLDGRSV